MFEQSLGGWACGLSTTPSRDSKKATEKSWLQMDMEMAEWAIISEESLVWRQEDKIWNRGLGNPSDMATLGTDETIGNNYPSAKTIKKKRHYGLNPHYPRPFRCLMPECSHAMMFLRNRNGKGIRLGKS